MSFDTLVTVFLLELKLTLKSDAAKAKAKKIVLKVYTTIKNLYADDPDFA